ncbi:hypothetical protein [Nocardioides sp. 1609]|uniref:hypothetical protein n=1 Tax=Nocardioides sp. 1609 TaxID=2508327 RepID=UPI001ADB9302|nr:hypothetical protein [Nocardioides sp. 1609]
MRTPTPLLTRFRRSYGAGPAHLLLLLAGLALAVHTVRTIGLDALWDPEVWWQSIAVWFIGAAVVHDLVLYPTIAAADTVIARATTRRRAGTGTRGRRRHAGRRIPVPAVNYVRVPLMACALVTVLFLPGIIRHGADTYQRATGQTQDPFLLRWALLCSAIVLLGLAAYLVARLRAPRRTPSDPPPPAPLPDRRAVPVPGGVPAGVPAAGTGTGAVRQDRAPLLAAALVALAVVAVVLVRRRGRA